MNPAFPAAPHRATAGHEPIRVVLIEDDRLARDQLAALLHRHPNFKVVATAGGVTMGVGHVQEAQPHVAVVDASLCHSDPHRCLERVKQMAPGARVVMMDVLPTRLDLITFIEAGANGFILKDASASDFVGAVRAVAQGTDVLPAALTSVVWSHLAGGAFARARPRPGQLAALARLSGRERQITECIAGGLANKEIAQRLHIATNTVKSHVHSILKKLGLHTRLQIPAAHAGRALAATPLPDQGASRPSLTTRM